ncbi:MAG: hypothetical protein NW206_17460 [Hyphomonadaceae bacterium]|nr:hypothetical protein [Hyphomonadaceae bacterium]
MRKQKRSPVEQAEHALKQVEHAAARGDRAEADRWLKIASQMAEVVRRVADAKAAMPEENAEEIRAELRARIARYCGAAEDLQAWEKGRDIREAVAAFAREHNLPEPPPVGPPPFTEHEMELTARGDYYPFSRQAPLIPEGARRFLGLPIED